MPKTIPNNDNGWIINHSVRWNRNIKKNEVDITAADTLAPCVAKLPAIRPSRISWTAFYRFWMIATKKCEYVLMCSKINSAQRWLNILIITLYVCWKYVSYLQSRQFSKNKMKNINEAKCLEFSDHSSGLYRQNSDFILCPLGDTLSTESIKTTCMENVSTGVHNDFNCRHMR